MGLNARVGKPVACGTKAAGMQILALVMSMAASCQIRDLIQKLVAALFVLTLPCSKTAVDHFTSAL